MKEKFLDAVTDICERLSDDEKNRRPAFELLLLRSDIINKFVNKFIVVDRSDVDDNILDLISIIIIAAKTVYESDKYCDPFDDVTYDKMLSKFKEFRDEPFGNNAVGLANAKYKYDKLSGTLDKVHFIYEAQRSKHETRRSMEDYINNLPINGSDKISVLINEKKDGTSVTVDYKLSGNKYVADSAISRGKKDYGEGTNVSAVMPDCEFTAKYIKDAFGYCPKYIGVQYEMLVSDSQKEKFEEYTSQKFANNRSAVAGLLRRIIFASGSESKILKKFVSLVPVGFDILSKYNESDRPIQWDDAYDAVLRTFNYGDIDMTYRVLRDVTKKQIMSNFNDIANEWLQSRSSLNHAIDGIVITIIDSDLQERLGRKHNINQYQIAYKFPEQEVKTKIRDIEITTGNFGYKEMLLIVDPVNLNGTIQKKAQVHSLDKFRHMSPRYGDEIILKLSGDVIPYGYCDDSCKRGDGDKIKWPTHCECGSPLIEEKNRLRCSNEHCPYRISGSFVTFFKELNAKGLGDKISEQLRDELHVTKPSQILKLKFEDFRRLKGFKDASAQQCVNAISDIRTRPQTAASIISSLGLDCLRASTAQKILDRIELQELIKLMSAGSVSDLTKIIASADGIDKNAEMIARSLMNNADEFKELLKLIPLKDTVDKSKLTKTILISGFRHDDEFTKVANAAGFDVKESGSKYDMLVIKNDEMMTASKAQYALAHNYPIMTKKEFISKYSS